MIKPISNWKDAVDDAYTFLNEKKRVHSFPKMLSLIDDLALRETATREEMIQAHGNENDFIGTTLGHVTTAIHGPGRVPDPGGWYRASDPPYTYHVKPEFAAAWRAKRRLPRSE